MIKIYIDLATRFGWAIYKDDKITDSGWVDLANDRSVRPMYKRSKQEQMSWFNWWLQTNYKFGQEKPEFIIEQPNTTGMFSSRKTLALFGICDLVIWEYKEIKNTVWFKWCIETYPHLKLFRTTKTGTTIDRKKTSIAIASYILDKDIKDDNEADAICMTAYDNKIIKEI